MPLAMQSPPLTTITALHAAYAAGSVMPSQVIAIALALAERFDVRRTWMSRVSQKRLLRKGAELDVMLQIKGRAIFNAMPLFGIPFAVADHLDVAGMHTAASSPACTYRATETASVVTRVQQAGAVLICKANRDKFITACIDGIGHDQEQDHAHAPTQSVTLAQILFSLTTDTDTGAGHCMPAVFYHPVGLKPVHGLIGSQDASPTGCSTDCIAIYANDAGDAWRVAQNVAGDPAQVYACTFFDASLPAEAIPKSPPAFNKAIFKPVNPMLYLVNPSRLSSGALL